MTCRCRAEFCMICGLKWKTCDCPWFNYQAVENDRLNHMNVPQARREAVRGADGGPRAYHEELERRREQERRDEAIARRMQSLDLDDGEDRGGIFAVGNAAGHFLNEHFVQRAADILVANYGRNQTDAADRLIAETGGGRAAVQNVPILPPPPPPLPIAAQPARPQPARRNAVAGRRAGRAPPERLVPRRTATDYASEAARHRPDGVQTAQHPPPRAVRVAARERRHSAMAGLTSNTTEGRVDEWRRHVEDE